jgi:ribose transport system substrate-binding protein
MKQKISHTFRGTVAAALMGSAALVGATAAQAQEDKLKVFVSFGYYGNTWMEQNRNMMTALANSADYRDKVDFEVQVVGNGDAQRQSQQINAMIEAGADIIMLYPVSPTAVNRAITNACNAGVMVVAWDSTVNAECATNVHADNPEMAVAMAKWVTDKVGGKGNVMMINGVSGVAANDDRVAAAKEEWAKSPGMAVAGEIEGRWSDPVVREEITRFMAVRSWDEIDIAWAQLGCFPFYTLQDEAGIADADKRPCGGSAQNSERLALLPADTPVDGATGTYRPMGIDGYTFEVGPIMGAKALWYAINARLAGKELPHDIIMPVPVVDASNVRLCTTGTWKELNEGCNTFPPAMVPNPESSVGIYDAELPQLGLKAALEGVPEY